ncbi:unnamed protein product [Thlaspi arvense]|uniref:Cation-transporting P-type ATPase N-terminal domain-containing protein n=1 Tax=Thlaspi arvense TaxID=13288 RepID=A0AAU9T7Q3_THLAR|nr:unnamed protein product [Thlaspi arvense]
MDHFERGLYNGSSSSFPSYSLFALDLKKTMGRSRSVSRSLSGLLAGGVSTTIGQQPYPCSIAFIGPPPPHLMFCFFILLVNPRPHFPHATRSALQPVALPFFPANLEPRLFSRLASHRHKPYRWNSLPSKLEKPLLDPENFNREGIDLERLPLEEVFEQLRTSRAGLTTEDAEVRLKIFGPNKLEEKPVSIKTPDNI